MAGGGGRGNPFEAYSGGPLKGLLPLEASGSSAARSGARATGALVSMRVTAALCRAFLLLAVPKAWGASSVFKSSPSTPADNGSLDCPLSRPALVNMLAA